MSQSSWLSTVLNPLKEEPDIYIPIPKTPTKKGYLNRDDRLRIQTLFLVAGWSKSDIALQLNVTLDQIRYVLAHQLTPQKRKSGRRPLLEQQERKRLIEWVCASAKNRRSPWKEIPTILGWDCKVYAMATTFKREGFARRSALKKPKLTAQHAKLRLDWAIEHLNWSLEQWEQILWTDETWIQPGKHKKVKVTRRPGEELHRDCIDEKVQRRIGWMF
jgi:hypothetical protein